MVALPSFLPFKPEFDLNAIIAVTLSSSSLRQRRSVTPPHSHPPHLIEMPPEKETTGSITCDGFVSSISALFGCLPITSFSQNIGLVAMTKVVNRYAIATGAIIMIIAGIFPAVGALLATLPDAVLGGCTIMMFGMIVMSGIQMMSRCGYSQRNITIASVSLSVGIGFTQAPELFEIFPQIIRTVFAENCVAVVFLVSVILNLLLPADMEATPQRKMDNSLLVLMEIQDIFLLAEILHFVIAY